jgi:hypothetical protein
MNERKEPKMLSKSEYFEFCPEATEEDYKVFKKQEAELLQRMWEEDHPLDD